MMYARLKCHVRRRSARIVSRRPQGIDFGVRLARQFVPTLTDHRAIIHEHTANHWIGMCRVQTLLRDLQRTRHECAFSC